MQLPGKNKMTIPEIVSKYRGEKSFREFAADINSKILEPISYQTIKDWEDGKYMPSTRTILPIAVRYHDWRQEFALKILAILDPGNYAPDQPTVSSQNS